MLDAILGTLKAGSQLKGMTAVLQHVESLSVNCLEAFCEGHSAKNDCIDAVCALLQSMKSDQTPVVPAPPAAPAA
jgi:hypothetical protein